MFSRVNILTTVLNIMKKFLNSKLVIMRKYQNTKKKKKKKGTREKYEFLECLLRKEAFWQLNKPSVSE